MTLQRGTDPNKPGGGAQTAVPRSGAAPNALGYARPDVRLPDINPVGLPDVYAAPYDQKRFPGLWYWRFAAREAGRAGFAQAGRADQVHAKLAYGDLVGDDVEVARQPFATNSLDTLKVPNADATTPDRMTWAEAFEATVMGFSQDASGTYELYKVTAAAPAPVKITGYAGLGTVAHMAAVQANGAQYLALGLLGNGTAPGYTVRFLSNLNNPPTEIALAAAGSYTGIDGCYGFVQVPIDDNALIFQAGKTLWAMAMNVALNSATPVARHTGMPEGGIPIGIVNVRGVADIAWLVLKSGGPPMLWNDGIPTAKHKADIWLFDLHGFLVTTLPVTTPWVMHATEFRGGIFYCDGRSHFYWTKDRGDQPVDRASDRVANSDKGRYCRGHIRNQDKITWEENEIENGGLTIRRTMEYDPILHRVAQVSEDITLTGSGLLTVGGPSLPYSSFTEEQIVYTQSTATETNGVWYRQHQPRANVQGFSERKTHGAASAVFAKEYAALTSGTWPAMQFHGIEGCPMWLARVTSPPITHIKHGQQSTGYTTPARVVMGERSSGISREFTAEEYEYRNGIAEDFDDQSYFYDFQPYIEGYRQTGGTDEENYALNVLPAIWEGWALKRGMAAPDPRLYPMLDFEARGGLR